jgi:hypothetical protein
VSGSIKALFRLYSGSIEALLFVVSLTCQVKEKLDPPNKAAVPLKHVKNKKITRKKKMTKTPTPRKQQTWGPIL